MRELAEKVEILSSFESSRSTAAIVEAIDRALPARVFLQGVSVTHFGPRAGEIVLVGIADTREDLLAFSDALKTNRLFRDVSIPVNQLVPEFDVEFSFSFGFTEQEL
jgi:Tfp pilus assembly protein PilN